MSARYSFWCALGWIVAGVVTTEPVVSFGALNVGAIFLCTAAILKKLEAKS